MRKLLLMLLIFLLIVNKGELCISAANTPSYEEEIDKLLQQMEEFELATLYEYDNKELKQGTKYNIKLSKDRMTRAAALSISDKNQTVYESYSENERKTLCSIDLKKLKKAGKNLFGKTLKATYITDDLRCSFSDAFNDPEYGPIVIYDSGAKGFWCSYNVDSLTIKKKSKKYTAVKKCFIGYSTDESYEVKNYSITYSLKKSSKSEYGYIIVGMKIKPLGEPEDTSWLYTDEDDDTMPLYVEISFGCNPRNIDTDRDGIPDPIEIRNRTDPNIPDKVDLDIKQDYDLDGLTDDDELKIYLTNPVKADTDGDGLKDGFEIEHGFDPLDQDSDGNGIKDGDEKFKQSIEEQAIHFGYKYDDYCEKTGETIPLFSSEYVIPDSFGAIKSVKVDMDIAGDIKNSVYIENVFETSVIASFFKPRVGIPIEIEIDKDFVNGYIIFEYYEDKIGKINEDDICLFKLDTNSNAVYLVEDAVVDTESNTVTGKLEKDYIYMMASQSGYLKMRSGSSL